MSRRMPVFIAMLWVVSLAGVAAWVQSPNVPFRERHNVGDVMTGDQIGFQRIAGVPDSQGKILGKLMVKVDGVWLEVQAPTK